MTNMEETEFPFVLLKHQGAVSAEPAVFWSTFFLLLIAPKEMHG